MTDVAALNHDDVTRMLVEKITAGVADINKANEILLADEQGTGVREIDAALKDVFKSAEFDDDGNISNEVENENLVLAWKAAEEAREAFKAAVDAARNLYRTEVLGVEAQETSEVDKETVKETRKLVVEALTLLKTYAGANGKKDVVAWADSLAVPQVGRQGTSVVGQKKPRAYVSVNGTAHDSFGEAAKAVAATLSSDDNKVAVSSGDLVQAWENANEAEEFEYEGLKIGVTLKSKAA